MPNTSIPILIDSINSFNIITSTPWLVQYPNLQRQTKHSPWLCVPTNRNEVKKNNVIYLAQKAFFTL